MMIFIARSLFHERPYGYELLQIHPLRFRSLRPLLALAVKQCATDAEAQEVVEYFYDAFDEAAGK